MDDPDLSRFDNQVVIGPRDVDFAILQRVSVFRMRGRQPAGAGEDFRQHAPASGQVQHDQDRRAKIARKRAQNNAERLYAPR